MSINLPERWQLVDFQEITSNLDGKRVPVSRTERSKRKGNYPYYGASGIIDNIDDYLFDGKYLLIAEDGANLLSRSTPIAFEATGKFWVNNHAHIVQTVGKIVPLSYLRYFFQSIDLTPYISGSAQPKLTQKNLKRISIPLPPLNEQHRIVAKIEALTARSRKARAALDAIPALLDQFRQSVLATAFRGDLTADWRAQNPDVEPAETLLERIREEKILSDAKQSRKPPKKPKDLKEICFDCPKNWETVLSHDLFAFVTSGSRGWAKYYAEEGPMFLRVGNLDRDTISLDLREVQKVKPPEGAEGTRTKVQEGDILVSITADVGMIALVEAGICEAYINQHVALARPISGLFKEYLAWYLASHNDGFQQFRNLQRGATKTGLGLADIRSIWVPFPPLEEQKEIVKVIELNLLAINEIETQYLSALGNFDQLNQSILAKAFRGQLVPQDPNDEPASVLLERIRTEREKTQKKKRKGKEKK